MRRPEEPANRFFCVGIRPEDVRPDPAGLFAGEITMTEPLGVETLLHVKMGEQTIVSTCPASQRCAAGTT